ncbi:extracellular solute-binding protein [Rhizobium lusitanum]|uniref:extracellular solute-binding protein n=1 Tax=Rhizobium lusitanum TaxID=293958 RepID=UPI0015722D1F|nr:extracellular solute-binding protein [Rhizobium lusitanum]NTJ11805.1 extracellular solute-binding protein [Rhizobium lusitanum]
MDDKRTRADGSYALGTTRRSILKGGLAVALAAPFVNQIVKPARAEGSGIVNISNFGGSYGDAMREIWFDPFEKETGIKVNAGPGASLALAKLQALNPAGAEWDIIDLSDGAYFTAIEQDLLAPIKGNVDLSKILPEYVGTHSWAYVAFVYVVGYNSQKIAASDAPQTWSDIWDKKRYSGKRALNNVDTEAQSIDVALMADGVPSSKVFPLNLDRAFASLDKLGRENIIWGMSLQDPVQQIGSGEAPTGGIYTGRAIMGNRQGAKIGMSLKQGIVGSDYLGVMKNSKNKKEAFELLNFIATRGDLAAKFTARTSYGIPHVDVEKLLPKEAADIRAFLPTAPELRETAMFNDAKYMAAHMDEIVKRFQEWQLS